MFLKLNINPWVYHSIRRLEWHHVCEYEIPWQYWAEDLNCFFSPLIGKNKLKSFTWTAVKYNSTRSFYLSISTFIINTLIDCANTVIPSTWKPSLVRIVGFEILRLPLSWTSQNLPFVLHWPQPLTPISIFDVKIFLFAFAQIRINNFAIPTASIECT